MPYDSMIIPLMMFLREMPHHDFSQMDETQARFIRYWYWNSIFAERYSGASTTTVVEDTKILVAVARKDYGALKNYFPKLSHQLDSVEALQAIYKKSSALYRGILNVVNARSNGLTDWKNLTKLSFNSKLEDHHIFPKDYLKKNLKDVSDKLMDCVLNRTLIPKITNIKIGAKKPSIYLQEIAKENGKLINSLGAHLIPQELMNGKFDDAYEIFLEERANLILEAIAAETCPGEKLKAQLLPTS